MDFNLNKLSFFNSKKPKKNFEKAKKKSALKEWVDAFVFAGIAALIIRTFIIEAFVIPTSSMERSLMVGDFLFVSKFHYGTRLPMLPLSLPFMHNRIPGTNTRSFLDWIVLPYMRLPGVSNIERNDVVVFNFPAEDIAPNNKELGALMIPSVKENYIKRCVAVPGDTIAIRDTKLMNDQLFVNGKPAYLPPEMQLAYNVQTNGEGFNQKVIEPLGFRNQGDHNQNWYVLGPSEYRFDMPRYLVQDFKKWSNVLNISQASGLSEDVYFSLCYPMGGRHMPFQKTHKTGYHFGPLVVPQKGMKIKIDSTNIFFYQRVIEMYEGHKVSYTPLNNILIDGKPVQDYTFAMDYYYMQGDNRYNSQDSRFWGFVPEDHIVGKPLFVFLSMEGGIMGIRWNRFFKGIN